MAIVPICIAGEPVLHQPSTPVDLSHGISPEVSELITTMYDTMDAAHGVGLAANQIGSPLRIFVYDCPDVEDEDGNEISSALIAERGGENRRGCVINPTLTTSTIPVTMPDTEDDLEGCLSVPGEVFPTGRAHWAQVTGWDEHGDAVTVEGYGFFARCLQHEVGHLDGFLYTDTLIGRYKKLAKKALKAQGWGVPGLTWDPSVDADPFANND